jgi:hypothetical protein
VERKFSNEHMARAAGYKPEPHSAAPGSVGLFLRNRAVARLCEGDAMGWDELPTALAYEAAAECLQMRVFKRIGRENGPGILALHAAHTLAALLVVGDRPFCVAHVTFLLETDRIGGLLGTNWCLLDWLLPLAAGALEVPVERGPTSTTMPAEYAALSKLWNTSDMTALTAALIAAADRHVAQTRTSNDRTNYDFDDLAYTTFPVELLAIYRLREWHGLPNPVLDHPLFEGLLGRLPQARAIRPDELLEKVVAKADRIYPDLPWKKGGVSAAQ